MDNNILLVESNIITQNHIAHHYRILGYNVDIANNYHEAFQLIKLYDYQLIFSNIIIEDNKGINFIKLVRNYERHLNKQPVYLCGMSNNNLNDLYHLNKSSGLNALINKKCTPHLMAQILCKSRFRTQTNFPALTNL